MREDESIGEKTSEVRAIIEKYRYDRKLRKYWDQHFFNDHRIFGGTLSGLKQVSTTDSVNTKRFTRSFN